MYKIFKFCMNCLKIVQLNGHLCPCCDSKLIFDKQKNHFLSGQYFQQDSSVKLPQNEILLDRYRIISHIGNGRIGSVYLAEDSIRTVDVVLKLVPIGPLTNDVAVIQLQHEVFVHGRISNHENILKLHDVHFESRGQTGLLFLSMEYADGGNFRKFLIDFTEDIGTRQNSGLAFFKEICSGVSDLHDANIIHLDLKPENFLFCENALKITDFGTAFCTDLSPGSISHDQEICILEMGTPIYMSPEHFIVSHPSELNKLADVYSLGIILYELLHPKCRPPFGGSLTRLRDHHLNITVPPLVNIEQKYNIIIDRCLKKDPAERYQNVLELINDLEETKINIFQANYSGPENLKKEKVEKVWQKASLCFSQSDFKEAYRLVNDVLAENSDHVQAAQLKKDLKERFDCAEQYYQEVEKGIDSNDPSALVDLLKKAVSIYPYHPSGAIIQAKIEIKIKQYRETMEQGYGALMNEQWEEALEWFSQAKTLNPKAVIGLKNLMISLSRIKHLRERIYQAIDRKDFKEAVHISRYVDVIVAQIMDQAPSLVKEEFYDGNIAG